MRGDAVDRDGSTQKVLQRPSPRSCDKQVELGIDVIDDGECGKPSFVTYVNERLGGFEPKHGRRRASPWATSREALTFPEFYTAQPRQRVGAARRALVCTGPITYKGQRCSSPISTISRPR